MMQSCDMTILIFCKICKCMHYKQYHKLSCCYHFHSNTMKLQLCRIFATSRSSTGKSMVWFLCFQCLFQKYPYAPSFFNSSVLEYITKKNIHFLKTLNFFLVVDLVEYILTKQFSVLKI